MPLTIYECIGRTSRASRERLPSTDEFARDYALAATSPRASWGWEVALRGDGLRPEDYIIVAYHRLDKVGSRLGQPLYVRDWSQSYDPLDIVALERRLREMAQ